MVRPMFTICGTDKTGHPTIMPCLLDIYFFQSEQTKEFLVNKYLPAFLKQLTLQGFKGLCTSFMFEGYMWDMSLPALDPYSEKIKEQKMTGRDWDLLKAKARKVEVINLALEDATNTESVCFEVFREIPGNEASPVLEVKPYGTGEVTLEGRFTGLFKHLVGAMN